ncbi:MAG: lipopolysaccharide heptosyltransferase II [Proteobacteria bacterium]|nr:lipopolysaccharide heptosyltransferase II [Pseudomonadota bacterium]HQR03800.1 lipopolysaccharide heptosyltransferase II [Rhodocyclaceae bacterium]
MKILVVAPSWIGDTLMAQPLLMRLAGRGAIIDVLAPDWCAPLYRRMPEVRCILSSPFRHGDFAFNDRRALGRCLRTEGYDEAIVLPNSWKSALVPFFAAIPKRTGYQGEARWGLLNHRHRLDKSRHPRLVERYAQLAEPPGGALPGALPDPRLDSSPEQQRTARDALGLAGTDAPYILCPGAEYGPAKRWPSRHFATLARHLAGHGPVWLMGSEKDAPLGEEIVSLSGGAARNLCGNSSLEQAIDLIAGARAVVSNDSGLMHVAAALDRPLVALYGSSSPDYTPPLSPRAKILTLNLSCSPCFERECPLGHFKCLTDLAPEQVIAALNA